MEKKNSSTQNQVDEYLKSSELSFIQDLLVQLAKKKPQEPIDFCITWLTNLKNKNQYD